MRPTSPSTASPDPPLPAMLHPTNPRLSSSKFQSTLNQFFCTISHSPITPTHPSPLHTSIPICPARQCRRDDDDTVTTASSDDSQFTDYSTTLNRKLRRKQLASAKLHSLPSTATKVKSSKTFAASMWKKVMDGWSPSIARTECQMNDENLKTNYAWGHMLAKKSPEVCHITSNNINGIPTDAHRSDLKEICHCTDQIEADVCCFQEKKLNTWN